MSWKIFSKFLLLAFLLTLTLCKEETIIKDQTIVRLASIKKGSVTKYELVENTLNATHDYIAAANYTKSLETIGWDLLAITTNPSFDDTEQAEASGYLEGHLTHERIYSHWKNLDAITWNDARPYTNETKQFFKDQFKYITDEYNKQSTDKVNQQAFLLLKQFTGLVNGYNEGRETSKIIEEADFQTMAAFGDMFDAPYYKNPNKRINFDDLSTDELINYFHRSTHCSALFKAKEDFSEIYFGHNSWFVYSATTRIFKEYNFNYKSSKAKTILFSGYPATIASNDDFYITSQDLAVIETTNVMFNNNLFDVLTPKSLLTWQRAMIANRLASNSYEWVKIFSNKNSGTYNNQFMVLDMKLVDTDNKHIKDDAMYIIEQIPGLTDINDVTQFLRYGYWPSYNTPFSKAIRKLSGIDYILETRPETAVVASYDSCARANIFRRDQHKVTNSETFQQLIRYNDYKNDDLSLKDPSNAISSRIDLRETGKAHCMGAYDAKMSSVTKSKGKNKKIQIKAGPTQENGLPVFKWSNPGVCNSQPKEGLPDEYNFAWYTYENLFIASDSA